MLQNYLKLAWRVLWRRKFFTFISLFGISFTLMSLMLFTAFFQTELGSKAPLSDQDKMIIFDLIELKKEYFDTIPVIDSSLIGGEMVYDTISYKHESVGSGTSTNRVAETLISAYYSDLESAKYHTIFATDRDFDIFRNNTKIGVKANSTDANFWKVFDFKFLEGKGYSHQEVEEEALKAVISGNLAMKYFGRTNNVVGQEIEIDAKNYKIIGVVAKPAMAFNPVQSDFYTPYTLREKINQDNFYSGPYSAIFVANNDAEAVKKEILHKNTLVPTDRSKDYNEVNVYPRSSKCFSHSNFRRSIQNSTDI